MRPSPSGCGERSARCCSSPIRSTTNAARRLWDFLALGLGEPFAVTALHGRGTGDLLDELVTLLPEPSSRGSEIADDGPDACHRPAVAIVGRPNVGKSHPLQPPDRRRARRRARHAGHDPRRDRHGGRDRRRTDPVRRHRGHAPQSRIDEGTEYYSLVRALRAVDDADVALLVIDATEGVTHQDQRLAERIDAAGLPHRRAAQQVGAARRPSSGST